MHCEPFSVDNGNRRLDFEEGGEPSLLLTKIKLLIIQLRYFYDSHTDGISDRPWWVGRPPTVLDFTWYTNFNTWVYNPEPWIPSVVI